MYRHLGDIFWETTSYTLLQLPRHYVQQYAALQYTVRSRYLTAYLVSSVLGVTIIRMNIDFHLARHTSTKRARYTTMKSENYIELQYDSRGDIIDFEVVIYNRYSYRIRLDDGQFRIIIRFSHNPMTAKTKRYIFSIVSWIPYKVYYEKGCDQFNAWCYSDGLGPAKITLDCNDLQVLRPMPRVTVPDVIAHIQQTFGRWAQLI